MWDWVYAAGFDQDPLDQEILHLGTGLNKRIKKENTGWAAGSHWEEVAASTASLESPRRKETKPTQQLTINNNEFIYQEILFALFNIAPASKPYIYSTVAYNIILSRRLY